MIRVRLGFSTRCARVLALLLAGPCFNLSLKSLAQPYAETAEDPALDLANEIGAIAQQPSVSRTRKEKLIAHRVTSAIGDAARDYRESSAFLRETSRLITAAVQAAPDYVDVIARSAAFADRVQSIDGAASRLRSAAFAARPASSSKVVSSTGRIATTTSQEYTSGRVTRANVGDPAAGNALLGDDGALRLSVATSVTYDSNVFLRHEKEKSDTIRAITPGVEYRFGQNSLSQGSVGYRVAIKDYQNDSAATTTLGTGNARFAYAGAQVKLDLSAYYQQTDQTTRDIASVAGNELIRTNLLQLSSHVEVPVAAKTSLQSGLSAHWVDYKRDDFLGSRTITVPLRAFFQVTPLLATSAGITYAQVAPDGDGPSSRDIFYNIGFRLASTEKLTSSFSVGYRTRSIKDQPQEEMWGFDGSLAYQLTSKSSFSLLLSRDFGNTAVGESTQQSNYTLNFAAQPTLRWNFSAGIGYGVIDYGERVFSDLPVRPNEREDTFWSGNLSIAYLINSWLRVYGSVLYRDNDSSVTTFGFNQTLATVSLELSY